MFFPQVYAAWETDEVIGFELWRNLGLAMICVFIITLIVLADFKICFMVLACVCLTLVRANMVNFGLYLHGINYFNSYCVPHVPMHCTHV